MFQHIVIGPIISVEPDILIVGEPVIAIDAIIQYEITKEFARIREETRTAMVFISHDLGVMAEIADQVLTMN